MPFQPLLGLGILESKRKAKGKQKESKRKAKGKQKESKRKAKGKQKGKSKRGQIYLSTFGKAKGDRFIYRPSEVFPDRAIQYVG
nr:hypothetical protein [uncultured Desulfuromonas sp.]